MGVNSIGSVFPMTQIISLSNFRSLSLIVNILWISKKIHPCECDYICDFTLYLSF